MAHQCFTVFCIAVIVVLAIPLLVYCSVKAGTVAFFMGRRMYDDFIINKKRKG